VDSTLDDELIANLKEQISNLALEEGASPSAPPTSMKTSRAPAGNDSSIGGLALCGFRRFSVGSIHWCRCLVVVILR
jgi:hypothetical protein